MSKWYLFLKYKYVSIYEWQTNSMVCHIYRTNRKNIYFDHDKNMIIYFEAEKHLINLYIYLWWKQSIKGIYEYFHKMINIHILILYFYCTDHCQKLIFSFTYLLCVLITVFLPSGCKQQKGNYFFFFILPKYPMFLYQILAHSRYPIGMCIMFELLSGTFP